MKKNPVDKTDEELAESLKAKFGKVPKWLLRWIVVRGKLAALLVFVACVDVTGLTDFIEERTAAEEITFVNCTPISFDISLFMSGRCDALNSDSTLILGLVPRWVSSCPACILVDELGELQVGIVEMAGVTITAFGPNGSSASSQQLESVP